MPSPVSAAPKAAAPLKLDLQRIPATDATGFRGSQGCGPIEASDGAAKEWLAEHFPAAPHAAAPLKQFTRCKSVPVDAGFRGSQGCGPIEAFVRAVAA